MVIFPIIIIVSLVLYLYYKVLILRSKDLLTQQFLNAVARIFLGIFIAFFGINQYLFYQTSIALYITIVFLFFGALQLYSGFKRAKHYRHELKKRDRLVG